MSYSTLMSLIFPALFLGILLSLEIGRRLPRRQLEEETERERVVRNTLEGAIYALLGLMIAFTFSGAASRFEERRSLTVQEANAIGTAYLRLDLLPTASQPSLREKFRQYTAARLAAYEALPDAAAFAAQAAQAVALQTGIWTDANLALKDTQPSASMLLLPALNDMIDITSTRDIMLNAHTPAIVMAALLLLAAVCALLAGSGFAGRRSGLSLHTLGFAFVLASTLYIIFDLDYPRAGLIQLDFADQALRDLLNSMK